VTNNQQRAAGRAIALFVRILRAPQPIGEASPIDSHEWHGAETPLVPSAATSLRSTAATLRSAVERGLRRISTRSEVWFIAYRPTAPGSPPRSFRRWGTDRRRWVADPCIFRHGETTYLFYEDFPYETRRGVISWSALLPDGSLTTPEVALARDYHLSYPFVFAHDGQIYMVPETSGNRSVELYRAVDFPRRWELHRTLLQEVNAVDATLHFDGRRWWMFVNIGEYGSSTWDELFLFFADSFEGPWQPHPANPVKCDPTSSRPAGRLFHRRGQLLRPAQDCSRVYGGGIKLCAIDVLNETEFREHVVESIDRDRLAGADGVHTYAASDGIEVIDGKWAQRPIWWPGYER
jgi:hypothetical protein